MNDILKIKQLEVSFAAYKGSVKAVRGVSVSVGEGESVALVGESGCGKSTVAQSILRLNPSATSKMSAQELSLLDVNLQEITEKEMEQIRGTMAAMIFQDTMTCLNPTMKVGHQITEMLRLRRRMSKADCEMEAIRLLESVQISDSALCARQYPHQLSGGMRQRAMIAMALSCDPVLLIADEPTTALDVTIQLEILRLLDKIRRERNMAILLITHDFSVVANFADRVAVMYAGKIVEEGRTETILKSPTHPYTSGLLNSLPGKNEAGELAAIQGNPPDLYAPPRGCAFAPRCESCMKICLREEPPMLTIAHQHKAACWKIHKALAEEGE